MVKALFQIDLNWYGENHRFFRWAHHEDFAIALAVTKLAKDLQIRRASVWSYLHSFDRIGVKIREIKK